MTPAHSRVDDRFMPPVRDWMAAQDDKKGNPLMGLFKDFKDMKDMVQAAPGMIDSAQQLQVNAQAQATAAQAQFGAGGMGGQAYVNNLNAGINGEPSADALKPID